MTSELERMRREAPSSISATETVSGPPIRFVDTPLAPDLFVTDAVGFFNFEGIISISMEARHVDHESGPNPAINRVVVGRLVMPAPAAHRLAVGLFDFLKKQGFDFDGRSSNHN